jgi:hypothetical protein
MNVYISLPMGYQITVPYSILYILKSNPHLNLIRTPFLPPCIVPTALSFGQTPALDRKSNPHSILIRICIFSPLKL